MLKKSLLLLFLFLASPLFGQTIISPGSGGGSGTSTNALLTNIVFVAANGIDASGARNDITRPYRTLRAAESNALSTDSIWVWPGTYVGSSNMNMGTTAAATSGTKWHLMNANITISQALASGDCIFGDGAVAKTFEVFGTGALSIHDTGGAVDGAVLKSSATTSDITLMCDTAVAGTSGSKGNTFWCSGGTQRISVNSASGRDNCFTTDTSATALQYINVLTSATASANGVFFNNAGVQHIYSCPVVTGVEGVYVANGGTHTYMNVGVINFSDTGIHGAVDGRYASLVDSGSAGYAIDGPNSPGIMDVTGGPISAGDRGITSRGDGVMNVTLIGNSANTAPNAIVQVNGTMNISGGKHNGNSALGAIQILHNGNPSTATFNSIYAVNSHASGPAMTVQGVGRTNIFIGGGALVAAGASANTCISSTNGTSDIVLIYGSVFSNQTNATLTTISTGTFTQNAAVK